MTSSCLPCDPTMCYPIPPPPSHYVEFDRRHVSGSDIQIVEVLRLKVVCVWGPGGGGGRGRSVWRYSQRHGGCVHLFVRAGHPTANKKHTNNAGPMLGHRLRRWPGIGPILFVSCRPSYSVTHVMTDVLTSLNPQIIKPNSPSYTLCCYHASLSRA